MYGIEDIKAGSIVIIPSRWLGNPIPGRVTDLPEDDPDIIGVAATSEATPRFLRRCDVLEVILS